MKRTKNRSRHVAKSTRVASDKITAGTPVKHSKKTKFVIKGSVYNEGRLKKVGRNMNGGRDTSFGKTTSIKGPSNNRVGNNAGVSYGGALSSVSKAAKIRNRPGIAGDSLPDDGQSRRRKGRRASVARAGAETVSSAPLVSDNSQQEQQQQQQQQPSRSSGPLSKKQRRKMNARKRSKSKGSSGREDPSRVLDSARFRYINEQLYSQTGDQSLQMFTASPESYAAYHQGFEQQVAKWPVNPLDLIIQNINTMPPSHVIADFGCGAGRLALSVRQRRVHSFDLAAAAGASHVTVCNVSAGVPLPAASVDVVVLCLALMAPDAAGCLLEANRVLRGGGKVRLAEVASRVASVDQLVHCLRAEFGFRTNRVDPTHGSYFYLFHLSKVESVSGGRSVAPGGGACGRVPSVTGLVGVAGAESAGTTLKLPLKPCLYKRR